APQELKNIYGAGKGYGYVVGDIVAVESIYIPVDVAFVRIKEKVWWDFILGAFSFFILFGLLYILFNNTVVSQLKGLLTTFRNIPGKDEHLAKDAKPESADEIGQLRKEFENVASYLKQIHEELKASEKKYRSLFETSQDTIFICDVDTRIIDINEAGLKLFKFVNRTEALAVESFYQLFWDARDAAALFATIQQKGFAKEREYNVVDRDGKRMHVMITANVRIDDNGMPCGFEGTLRDVTEKRRLARYLAQAEKMSSIGQLAAGVAHEINNPLGVIECYANLIRKESRPDSQAIKDIEIIKKHTLQCKSVVEDLLNFARVSEPKMVKADINACIEGVLSVVERQMNKENIAVQRKFSPDIPLITMDVQKMKQVFMNLIMNAGQAIEKDGVITIVTEFQQKDKLVAIHIEDTGCGIAKKDVDQIFDPFFTTKGVGSGTGLGLSVSYGIIEQHGGQIHVKNAQGKGSIFTIILPATNTENNKIAYS
ncbi:MAG: PAS domain S-box protein, partial [Proteobacteria bacterium]|nr:PAS domain S-box protein [Pseudomonadota bacterium]